MPFFTPQLTQLAVISPLWTMRKIAQQLTHFGHRNILSCEQPAFPYGKRAKTDPRPKLRYHHSAGDHLMVWMTKNHPQIYRFIIGRLVKHVLKQTNQ